MDSLLSAHCTRIRRLHAPANHHAPSGGAGPDARDRTRRPRQQQLTAGPRFREGDRAQAGEPAQAGPAAGTPERVNRDGTAGCIPLKRSAIPESRYSAARPRRNRGRRISPNGFPRPQPLRAGEYGRSGRRHGHEATGIELHRLNCCPSPSICPF